MDFLAYGKAARSQYISDREGKKIYQHKITYNGNGAEENETPDQSYRYGEEIEISAPQMWKDGKVFSNWNTMANGSGSSYDPGDRVTLTMSSFTLYAQWEDFDCTLTLNGSGVIDANGHSTLPNGLRIRTVDQFGYGHTVNTNGLTTVEVSCPYDGNVFLETSSIIPWCVTSSGYFDSRVVSIESTNGLRIKVPESGGAASLYLMKRDNATNAIALVNTPENYGTTPTGWIKESSLLKSRNSFPEFPQVYYVEGRAWKLLAYDPFGYMHYYDENNVRGAIGTYAFAHVFPGCEVRLMQTPTGTDYSGVCRCYLLEQYHTSESRLFLGEVTRTTTFPIVMLKGNLPGNLENDVSMYASSSGTEISGFNIDFGVFGCTTGNPKIELANTSISVVNSSYGLHS